METESTSRSGILNWVIRLVTKATSGRTVPLYCSQTLPPRVIEAVRHARAVWLVVPKDGKFDIAGLFGHAEKSVSCLPAHNNRRVMLPCPVHGRLDRDSQIEIVRRSKLAQSWGLEVKWVDDLLPESMIIINPPTRDSGDFEDGVAFVDFTLPHTDTSAPAKFEITQADQDKIFSDLVKSFSQVWAKSHEPRYEKAEREQTRTILKGSIVA